MKSGLLAASLMVVSLIGFSQDKEMYVQQYKDIAISEMHRTGIPASIKLAQAILESNYGRSELAREAHNHFGIKCGRSWAGGGYNLKDDDRNAHGELVHSCFRVFGSPEESFIAHSDFLTDPGKANRYGPLFKLAPDDYKGWAEGLQRGGYATNPSYARLLIRIIEEQHLDQYDARRMDHDLATHVAPHEDGGSPGYGQIAYAIRYQNDLPYVIAHNGDNAVSLSKRIDVPARRIVRFNEGVDSKKEPLEDGERIYLEQLKKKYHGNQKSHVVEPGETILKIAQEYGVRTKQLRKRNHMSEDCEPAPGSRIMLRGKQKKTIPCVSPNSSFVSAPAPKTPSAPATPSAPPATRVAQSEPRRETIRVEAAAAPAGLSDVFVQQALSPSGYTVQPKDTLYGIASQHGITVAELKEINNLTSDVIHPGQSLKVQK